MDEKKIKKAGAAALTVSVLSIGTIAAVSAYQSGIDFQPSDADQELQTNQIVFSGEEDKVGKKKKNSSEESELWKKKQDEELQKSPRVGENADYLFESGYMSEANQGENVAVSSDNTTVSSSATGANQSGQIYDITDDTANADLIIGNGGAENSGNGSLNSDALDPSQGGHTGETNGTLTPGTNGNNGTGGSGGKPGSGGTGEEENPTKPRPSATAKDPESGTKSNPTDSVFDKDKYEEGKVPGLEEDAEQKAVIRIEQSTSENKNFLYKGQQIDGKKIFYSLDTYVIGSDYKFYLWGADALDKYVRIDAVSFDAGVTWNTEFPLTIPSDLEENQMVIKVSYRLKTSDTQWKELDVPYAPEDTCFYLLSREVEEGETVIDEKTILNQDDLHPQVGSMINLYGKQWNLFGDQISLDALFPGWMEDGKLVPWFYDVTAGRHILEPAEMVPLSDEYKAELHYVWLDDNNEVDDVNGSKLCYLQMLTNVEHKNRTHLNVPKYIQAVRMDEDAGITTDYLQIPDTVFYIDESMRGLQVNKGFSVDENNPKYLSNEDGLLMNKSQEIIYAIPYKATEVTVPSTVTKVNLASKNQITTLILEETSYEQFPELTYKNLKNCQIQVKEEFLNQFLLDHWDQFGKNVTVSSIESPEEAYHVERGMVLNQNGDLHYVINNGSSVKLEGKITKIRKDAFAEAPDVETLILSKEGTEPELEEGAFAGSNLKRIYCYTQEQYHSIKEQIASEGVDTIEVALMQTSLEGYGYSISSIDGVERATVLDAPENVVEFDGTVTAQDGTPITVTAIGDSAFAQSEKLEWVTLPESVDTIGYMAFADCKQLQGVLIDTKDTITIGDKSFDGCDSLRFLASNALTGIMVNDYDPIICSAHNTSNYFFYVPTGALGYTSHALGFTEASGVTSYEVERVGETGRVLYGLNDWSEPWLVLRSGSKLDDEVILPETTVEVWRYAFDDAKSPSGCFSINFDEMPDFWGFDGGAMFGSDFGGDVVFPENVTVGEQAMQACNSMTTVRVEGGNIFIGSGAFANCKNLTSATIGAFGANNGIPTGMFEGCDSLTDLYFESATPDYLVLNGNMPFCFNSQLDVEEEQLRVHVPSGSEEAYYMKWRYGFTGYTELWGSSAYQLLWEDTRFELIDYDTWMFPEDEVVDAAVKQKVLAAENKIRKMLGIDTVEEPTNYFPYRVDNFFLTMVGAPSYLTSVRLSGDALDLPDGWEADYIGTGMFQDAKQLREVIFPENIVGIHKNAFEGVESDSLTLRFESENPPTLMLDSAYDPFEFGVNDSKLHIEVPEGSEETYVENWQYPLAGYSDRDEMETKVRADLTDEKGEEPTDEEVEKEIENRLFDVNNRLRAMLGMEQLEREEEPETVENQEQNSEDEKENQEENAEDGKEDQKENVEDTTGNQEESAGDVSENLNQNAEREEESEEDLGISAENAENIDTEILEFAPIRIPIQTEQSKKNESKEETEG